jgi:hypothetical protein
VEVRQLSGVKKDAAKSQLNSPELQGQGTGYEPGVKVDSSRKKKKK